MVIDSSYSTSSVLLPFLRILNKKNEENCLNMKFSVLVNFYLFCVVKFWSSSFNFTPNHLNFLATFLFLGLPRSFFISWCKGRAYLIPMHLHMLINTLLTIFLRSNHSTLEANHLIQKHYGGTLHFFLVMELFSTSRIIEFKAKSSLHLNSIYQLN